MCVVGSGGWSGACVYGSAGVVHHGQIFYDFSFGHGTPHMRKINRNSTSLQVHVVCVHTLNIIYKNFF